MKFNKWTLGLATVGAVSLASAARADEKMNSLQTALSNTTISGYVSASMNWAVTPSGNRYQGSPAGFIPFQGATKQDGFNLDVVKLSIAKPEDESPWASGYQVDLWFGPDAVNWNSSVNGTSGQDFSIAQAYVTLRTPVGNGIDWKIGVFDTIIGYESRDASSDPNYTRSWGWFLEPTEHTGILATYKINDMISVSAGIANTLSAGINNRAFDFAGGRSTVNRNNTNFFYGYSNSPIGYLYNNPTLPVYPPGTTYGYFSRSTSSSYTTSYTHMLNKDWNKTLMGSATFTAPTSWGWAAGSSIYAGFVWGFNQAFGGGTSNNGFYADGNQVNYYLGVTMNTPWKQLTGGLAFDYVHNLGGGRTSYNNTTTINTSQQFFAPATYTYNYNKTISGYSAHIDAWTLGVYATFRPTDKLSLNLRGEYLHAELDGSTATTSFSYGYSLTGGVTTVTTPPTTTRSASSRTASVDGFEVTATAEYDLWANVIARVEGRWDSLNSHGVSSGVGSPNIGGNIVGYKSSLGLYANVIYKF